MSADSKIIRVLFFAELAEVAGCAELTWKSDATDLRCLYSELKTKFGFRFDEAQLKPSRANRFCKWEDALVDNDEVSFLPPFSGG